MAIKKFPTRRVVQGLAKLGALEAKKYSVPRIESTTLADNVKVEHRRTGPTKSTYAAHIPHYWAVFRNDGTKAKKLPKGKWFAIFPNPLDDPRHRGRYPKRLANRRKLTLTRKRIKRLKKQGKMYFTNRISAAEGDHFFDNGPGGKMALFAPVGAAAILKQFRGDVLEFLGDDFKIDEYGITLNLGL